MATTATSGREKFGMMAIFITNKKHDGCKGAFLLKDEIINYCEKCKIDIPKGYEEVGTGHYCKVKK